MNRVAYTLAFLTFVGASTAIGQENDQEWREYIAMGDEHFAKSEFEMAEEDYHEAHRLAQQFDERDPRRAYTAVKVADLYARDDRRPKARLLYQQAAERFTEQQDDGLEQLAYCEKALADLDTAEGKSSEALEHYVKTLRILEVLEQLDNPNAIASQFGIARAQRLLGKLPDSEKTFQILLKKVQQGTTRPTNLGEILAEYANLQWQKGDLARADLLFQEATKHAIDLRGELHREVADILVRRSILLAELQRSEESKQLLARSQEIYRDAH
jgi:tetratricopeptide (TPR) repeat protein